MKKSNSSVKLLVIITIAIIGLIVALVLLNNAKNPDGAASFSNTPNIEGQPIIGDKNAPITVIEFGDFKCPACKSWGENIYPQLEKDFIDNGNVKFAYVNVLFHGVESQVGSLAAETVLKQSPENYWAFHQALFAAQPANQRHDEPWLTAEKVLEIVSEIDGIDVEQFEASFLDAEYVSEVEKDVQLIEEYEVNLTPTIFINNKMVEDPFDYEKIKSLIEKELEGR